MEKLRGYFENIGLGNRDLDKILSFFKLKYFEKDDFFASEGKVSKHVGFLEQGLFMYYVLNDGEERTTYVAMENNFIASLFSFLNESPSKEYIRALSNAKVWMIDKKSLRDLQIEIPAFKDFYIGLLEWQICCIDKSRLDFIMLTAEQRYEKMITEEPTLLQQIPLQYLASILGVTPRHLSRIRKNIR